jgi:hypothetical protein
VTFVVTFSLADKLLGKGAFKLTNLHEFPLSYEVFSNDHLLHRFIRVIKVMKLLVSLLILISFLGNNEL